jgi:hypothetical protein
VGIRNQFIENSTNKKDNIIAQEAAIDPDQDLNGYKFARSSNKFKDVRLP